jgi:hypothetical protein
MMNLSKLACICSLALASIGLAETPAAPAEPPAPTPTPILQGRPDAHVVNDEALGTEFRSLAAGIAFKPPANGKEVRRAIGGDEIVQFVYEKEKWQLKVSRLLLTKSVPLMTDNEKGKDGIVRQGLLETMAQQLKVDMGGAEILRQDPINLIDTPVGMIAARYNVGAETRLTQRALVQANEQENLYYVFDFATPAPRTGPVENDPECKKAVELFSHVVESIQVLDQSQILKEQKLRLFNTKLLYVNITEPKLRAALKPERWLRLIRDGKDIGYSYVVEEVASGLPHKKQDEAIVTRAGNVAGIRVGVRSRTYPDVGMQVDAESWSWVAMDKKQEEWSSVLYIQNERATDPKLKSNMSTESGVSIWRVKPVKDAMMQQADNPGIRMSDDWKLSVTSNTGEPVSKDLPVFYLPRTLDHLLPRLVPMGGKAEKQFMFASYVSEQKEIIRRYVDVGTEGEYILAGNKIHAVPVRDRLGLEGSVTTHYVTPEGEYLGSINTDSKVTILPTDAVTLQKMWKDVNLTRPSDVEAPGIKPSAQAPK